MNILSCKLGCGDDAYAYVDLLAWFETKSEELCKLIEHNREFASAQMAVAIDVVKTWNPHLIVCPFAAAADRLREFLLKYCLGRGMEIGDFQDIPAHTKLRATMIRLQATTAAIPIIRCQSMPNGAWSMTQAEFCDAVEVIRKYWEREN